MTPLELAGFRITESSLTPEEFLFQVGIIARKRKGAAGMVDVVLWVPHARSGPLFVWTMIPEPQIHDIIVKEHREAFLISTVESSFNGWKKLPVTTKVYDIITFYDRRVFTDNNPNRTFSTLPELIQFLNQVTP